MLVIASGSDVMNLPLQLIFYLAVQRVPTALTFLCETTDYTTGTKKVLHSLNWYNFCHSGDSGAHVASGPNEASSFAAWRIILTPRATEGAAVGCLSPIVLFR